MEVSRLVVLGLVRSLSAKLYMKKENNVKLVEELKKKSRGELMLRICSRLMRWAIILRIHISFDFPSLRFHLFGAELFVSNTEPI